jgi:hypothetical protein
MTFGGSSRRTSLAYRNSLKRRAQHLTFSKADAAGSAEPTDTYEALAQGRAAILLIESLMHALVGKGLISREEFIEIVEGAAEVELELAQSKSSYPAARSGVLLPSLVSAFKRELGC